MRGRVFPVIAVTGSLFLSACISLLPESAAPSPRYEIAALDAGAIAGAPLDWSLAVDAPRAPRAFDVSKIAVSTEPGKIEYYADAEWTDRAPRLLHTALLQSIEDSGRILAVGDRASMPLANFVLETDLRRVQLEIRGGAPAAAVSVYARLGDGRGSIYATRLVERRVDAASDAPDDVLDAFDEAFNDVLRETVSWTFEQAEAVEAARAADGSVG